MDRPPTLAHYLAVLRRRKLVILPPLLLLPTIAFFLSAQQPPLYRATSEVLLNRQDIVGAVADVPELNSVYLDPERLAATQSDVARSPLLARRVVAAANVPGLTESALLGKSQVSPRPNADVLEFSVTDGSHDLAVHLASVYGEQYTSFRRDIDTKALREAMQKLQTKIASLERRGARSDSPLYAQLLDAQTKLETAATLLTGNTLLLRRADGAAKISPRPQRSAMLGGMLAIVLALGLAVLAEALDSRVRAEQEIEGRLRMPQLGRLPRPRGRLRRADKLVMLAEPGSPGAEAVRQLRTNLELAIMKAGARAIMVTSALVGEGKSTTVANLAVALARAGRRVVLVDLDLRRPYLHRFFNVTASPGITEVTLGRTDLNEALEPLPVSEPQSAEAAGRRKGPLDGAPSTLSGQYPPNGHPHALGALHLLTAGTVPLDPGEFVADGSLADVLAVLREWADIVLIDAPPMLTVGDATVLSARVDALIAVFRLRETRRAALVGLARQLERCPATKLGFVTTDAALGDDAWYYEPYDTSEPVHAGRVTT
jgi:Mrp family chromosome partitioning ATPase/capsular polysaccharide biosynthesis protein